jgi:carbon-monoxide dehydrogenase medium subunit
VKPVPFDYACPDSVAEAIALLHEHGEDAKVLAGGQSLMPMLNFRVVRPAFVVDLRSLVELDYVRERADGGLSIGGMTKHRVMETSPLVAARFPVIPEAMKHVAHLAIRNRGTIGGSLAHADPASELPMLVRLLDGSIVVQSVRGERVISANAFFTGPLSTVLAPDELLVRVDLPGLPRQGWAFEEFARRAGDLALAAVGVGVELERGCIRSLRVAMMGVADLPLRLDAVETALVGKEVGAEAFELAVEVAKATVQTREDLHASAAFRQHLAGVLLRRTLSRACATAAQLQEVEA